ncbi:hypothetical protein TSOC_007013 [Tetrabaena socialis]|uniref:Uncharacterized protein n=1 Tax=Tetrabaena socialis TaxID=47790 RepID=A0A2J8A233_9CHLO|nr:hypothetical protein TSOC_007013 [Tetrabaena socialis]|eukprot:PNH06573.1 hypothetical protein TSOC_007013 [Tetrabaena socialis]
MVQHAERHATRIMHTITPKQEGDAADVSLICISTLIFMWVAASMYRVYAFAFYASGQQTIGELLWGS